MMFDDRVAGGVDVNFSPQVVIRDHEGHWLGGLHRTLGNDVRLLELETLPPLNGSSRRSPAWLTLIVTSLATRSDDLWWIATWKRRQHPGAVIACLPCGEPSWASYARAAGATWTFSDLQDLPRAARLVLRIARQMPSPPLSWREQIWNNLPWSEVSVRD